MNNEINKESGDNKPKMSIQNILAGFLVVVIIFVITIISSGGVGSGMAGVFYMYMIGAAIVFGIILVSLVGGVVSSVKLIKNKDQSTLTEKNIRKKWLIFDVFSFLVVPIIIVAISAAMGNIFGAIIPSVLFIILASGIQTVIRNKESNLSSRISGWFLITFGVIFLLIISYLFLNK